MRAGEAKVFLVDCDRLFLQRLVSLVNRVGYISRAFSSANEFLSHYDFSAPGCAIIEVEMPGLNGFEIQERLAATGYCMPVIFMARTPDVRTSVRAIKAGAVNFLSKPFTDEEFLCSLQEALLLDLRRRCERAEALALQKRIATLTPREAQVFRLVASGLLNKQVAAQLGAREKTIKVHRGRMMKKMQAHSVAELVVFAAKSGILPSESQFKGALPDDLKPAFAGHELGSFH